MRKTKAASSGPDENIEGGVYWNCLLSRRHYSNKRSLISLNLQTKVCRVGSVFAEL
jgi:hypothetical protein